MPPKLSSAIEVGPLGLLAVQTAGSYVSSAPKRSAAEADVENEDPYDDDDDDSETQLVGRGEPIKWNCNQVRTRIRSFIDNGGMKVTEFQRAIGVNPVPYRNFMAQNGPYKGENSSVYQQAYFFFREREARGLKMPRKRAKAAPAAPAAPATPSATTSSTSAAAAKKGRAAALTDFGDLRLAGEETRSVKVYDSCDEIRRKINAHLQLPEVTQASFLRDVAGQLGPGRSVQGVQLTAFRSKHGPDEGASSCVYYGAYVFFEKIRIQANKPKSKHRLGMEK
ncbi:hypothetical protein CcaverHIS002_0212830 [Cutaneotrichosporon cavernicola]|uniref:DUF7726 domain-containing protein n=1 Tax=Cutaneotrichosporon cavernicola TaxID=279322 RepID=A0AA48I2I1_9TREE|nr:uncharacterized protein CcaverHIS019_0212830 [Cutaneotrichosporon cavernicola]BEI82123.1 hypothetical protein CcaverHIS002_0212830 [Cutaneotrichosporon cavernicola]BEI89921.1 hypothetical protein CcaverHIS019_0212830 [Cutaneotrichosporon cavernicola]BEI97692.1 hypothetical protein CcaverHIS631_0212810 [Cutaneotrichosporon cavernicola]BEJ05469.1 hypothetical protein CcaverHIS641_0212860 [Cutaneotrichosporon cavernicola]